MTSTRSTMLAGSDCRKLPSWSPVMGDVRPFTCTATFWLPRRLTLPSWSTSTAGTLRSTSVALPPAVEGMSRVL